ncbi:hypothetical protein BFP77_11770 [Maribacter sp. 4U21]|uniref:hypothetical protein n=1 Tax=Maribacter sp. 4U21 TaxID=1889779 RepID=UPI000C161A45|nr:hypothetical protein [Maribacter sp. 4U21]PIB27560.1 hypothetical protein BFP77_11770 [Maribacter sp. 4U21]
MNRIVLSVLIAFFSFAFTFAQEGKTSFLELTLGRNIHGAGDIPGYQYGFHYGQEFSNKLFWQVGLEGTLNDKVDFPLTYEDPNGNVIDASLHTVTAGFQLVSGIRYAIIKSNRHEVSLSALPLFRYQATSLSGLYDTLFPEITGLPFPVRNIVRTEPGRTFAVGGSIRVQYNYEITNDFYIGVFGAFQGDTNGDSIPLYSLSFGKRF